MGEYVGHFYQGLICTKGWVWRSKTILLFQVKEIIYAIVGEVPRAISE